MKKKLLTAFSKKSSFANCCKIF